MTKFDTVTWGRVLFLGGQIRPDFLKDGTTVKLDERKFYIVHQDYCPVQKFLT